MRVRPPTPPPSLRRDEGQAGGGGETVRVRRWRVWWSRAPAMLAMVGHQGGLTHCRAHPNLHPYPWEVDVGRAGGAGSLAAHLWGLGGQSGQPGMPIGVSGVGLAPALAAVRAAAPSPIPPPPPLGWCKLSGAQAAARLTGVGGEPRDCGGCLHVHCLRRHDVPLGGPQMLRRWAVGAGPW